MGGEAVEEQYEHGTGGHYSPRVLAAGKRRPISGCEHCDGGVSVVAGSSRVAPPLELTGQWRGGGGQRTRQSFCSTSTVTSRTTPHPISLRI